MTIDKYMIEVSNIRYLHENINCERKCLTTNVRQVDSICIVSVYHNQMVYIKILF